MHSLLQKKAGSITEYLRRLEALYERYERHIGSATVLIGFTVDMLMFRRIDLFFDTLVMFAYLALAIIGISIVNLYEGEVIRARFLDKIRLWLPLVIQYSFGALFSAFVVFYIKSASLATSWPFLLILAGLLVGNEFFRKRYLKLAFHMSVFFIALFSFTIFYMPIFLKRMGWEVFILSGLVSLMAITAFIVMLAYFIPQRVRKAGPVLIWSIGSVFLLINLLYFTNIIPPIPLSLKAGGVYHYVAPIAKTSYQVQFEERQWYEKFLPYERIHLVPGETVYIFSSVFAPTNLRTGVRHHWQYWDKAAKKWISSTRISYPIRGGRDEGYRGYSLKAYTFPGYWRVDIETERGQVIGRIKFKIEKVNKKPPLISAVL